MVTSERNTRQLALLRDIYEVSELCATRTYIWAGLAQDVLAGEFLREHGDVDGFTRNLWSVKDDLAALYGERGYAISVLEEFGMLRIEREGVHAAFNRLEIDGDTAMWRHIGDQGTVYFPRQWLSDTPHRFYAVQVYVSGVQFEYCIKTHPQLLNPEWRGRPKDVEAAEWLEEKLREMGASPEEILKRVWSYNPFWAKRGYIEYTMPGVAWALAPRT